MGAKSDGLPGSGVRTGRRIAGRRIATGTRRFAANEGLAEIELLHRRRLLRQVEDHLANRRWSMRSVPAINHQLGPSHV
jgi:hypothetical protein